MEIRFKFAGELKKRKAEYCATRTKIDSRSTQSRPNEAVYHFQSRRRVGKRRAANARRTPAVAASRGRDYETIRRWRKIGAQSGPARMRFHCRCGRRRHVESSDKWNRANPPPIADR